MHTKQAARAEFVPSRPAELAQALPAGPRALHGSTHRPVKGLAGASLAAASDNLGDCLEVAGGGLPRVPLGN